MEAPPISVEQRNSPIYLYMSSTEAWRNETQNCGKERIMLVAAKGFMPRDANVRVAYGIGLRHTWPSQGWYNWFWRTFFEVIFCCSAVTCSLHSYRR